MLLSKMRSGIFSYIFLGCLTLGTIGLVLMDWTGSYRNGGGSNDVAVVGGDKIGTLEFDRMARRVIRSQKMDAQTAYQSGIIDQILEMQVMDMLMQKAARDYGVSVDDKHIASQINTMLEPMAKQAGLPKKDVLARVLQSQGMSEGELVQNLRADLERGILRNAVAQNYYVPNVMASDLYAYQQESRTVNAVVVSFDSIKPAEPDDVDLAAYFDKVKELYTEPESRSFKMAVLNPDDFGKKVEISDKEVRAYYDQHQDTFKAQERRLLQQAVVDTQAKAEEILKAAKDKKVSLQDAVKKVTGDTKAFQADSGYEQAGLPAQLAQPIFAAPENSYVGPLKSPLGYHVIFVKTKQAAQIQPFDTVKENIRKDLMHDKKADEIFQATNSIEDRLASGESFEDLSKELGLTVLTMKNIRMSTRDIPELKPYGDDEITILQTAFTLPENESSPLAELKDGRMYAIRVDDIKTKRQKELKEVKADVIAAWKRDEQKKKAGEAVSKALDQIDAKKLTLADFAKERASKVQTYTGLNRKMATPPAGLTEGNLQQIMAAKKGMAIAMPNANGLMIGQVTAIQSTTKPPADKELLETKDALGKDVSQENLLSFVDALQQDYKVIKNKKLLEQMYAKPADQAQ